MYPGKLMSVDELRDLVEYLRSIRSGSGLFDVANIGWTTGVDRKRDAEKVTSYAEAGMTWWLEGLYTKRDSPEGMKKRISLGPPTGP
jgi:hypothetical protein